MPGDRQDRSRERADEQPALSFPDVPRLELDQLLDQLVHRAQEVKGTQGRLRSLLRANRMIRGLDQPDVLRHAVRAARELVGARYAAIGVAGPSGLADFLHDGMEAVTVARMGHLPHGKGLLGALLEDPSPLRLARLTDDARSAGLPDAHPAMESFLAVPIRVRGEVFGAFYLVDDSVGRFTAEDEELLGAFAASVGDAIDSARLYEAAHTRGEWLAASAAITRQLLSVDPDRGRDPLQLIAERTQQIADADLVLVLRPCEPAADELTIEVSVGADAATLRGRTLPVEGSLSGRVFASAEPVRLAQLADGTGLSALTSGEIELGPLLAVPLHGSDRVHGVLTAARLNGRPAFAEAELDMAASFANHAALAIELAEARAQQQVNALLDDRERIAAELHDHVIARLFTTGLTLQGAVAGVGSGPTAARLHSAVADLDEAIRAIRSVIFQLHAEPQAGGRDVRTQVLDVLGEASAVLRFEPALRLTGSAEDLSTDVVDDLVVVLRTALGHVADGAGACAAAVDVHITDDRLTVRITHDGTGRTDSHLGELGRRAEARHGVFEVEPVEPSGACLRWSVPIS